MNRLEAATRRLARADIEIKAAAAEVRAAVSEVLGQRPCTRMPLPEFRAKQVEAIIQITAEYHGVTPADILGRSRRLSYVTPRQQAMALCRSQLGMSSPEIGDAFNGRDHGTALWACSSVVEHCDAEPGYVSGFAELTKRCRAFLEKKESAA